MRFVYHYDINIGGFDPKKTEDKLRETGWLASTDKIAFVAIQGNSYIASICEPAPSSLSVGE